MFQNANPLPVLGDGRRSPPFVANATVDTKHLTCAVWDLIFATW